MKHYIIVLEQHCLHAPSHVFCFLQGWYCMCRVGPISLFHLPPSIWRRPRRPATRLAMLDPSPSWLSPSSSSLSYRTSPLLVTRMSCMWISSIPLSGSPSSASLASSSPSSSLAVSLSSSSFWSLASSVPSHGVKRRRRLALYSPVFNVPSRSSNL